MNPTLGKETQIPICEEEPGLPAFMKGTLHMVKGTLSLFPHAKFWKSKHAQERNSREAQFEFKFSPASVPPHIFVVR